MVNQNTSGQFNARELAERAGTTVRTVHYYVSEGILPPPEGTTRNALYSADHLARLRIVAALRAEGLSLAAIRSRLALLGDEGIQEIRETLDRFEAALQAGDVTVLGLVEATVVDQTRDEDVVQDMLPQVMSSPPPSQQAPDDSARAYVDRMLSRPAPPQPRAMHSRREVHVQSKLPPVTWHHFTIEDGIEVRVREDRLRPERRQIEAFIDAVRDIARRGIRRRDI
ncbi:hypothetical protein BH23CHL4_BH23CHL4_21970 [soil metagenome]